MHPELPQGVASHRRLGRRNGDGAGGRREKFAPDFVEKIALILKHTPADWGILLIGFWLKNHASGANDNDYAVNQYVHRVFDFMLTDCYLITRATAQALLRSAPVDGPLDGWISRQSRSIPIYRHTSELGPPHESFTPRKKRWLHQSSRAAGSAGRNQRDRSAPNR